MKSLYPGLEVSGVQVVFDFLHYVNLAKKLADSLQDKKAVGITMEKAQKWIISQNCEIVKRFMWQ